MNDLRRLAQDPAFQGLFEEGGIVYKAMESLEVQALRPETPIEKVRVLQGRLQGLRGVRDLVNQAAKAVAGEEIAEAEADRPQPRLMRVVTGG